MVSFNEAQVCLMRDPQIDRRPALIDAIDWRLSIFRLGAIVFRLSVVPVLEIRIAVDQVQMINHALYGPLECGPRERWKGR